MPKIKAKRKLKAARPKCDPPEEEMSEEEITDLQDMVLSKPDATAKPKLNTVWPALLVVSILSCIGIPFIPSAERLLLASFVLCAAIWSTYKIFRYEKDIHQWYIDNPEFAKKKKSAKTFGRKPVKIKS